ncbi:MAG TPA: hypothetical protein VM327_07795 [Candidatus Thermoplasmatota archaeon]|nr:hypothetical protein [Candidatus Thermoplasmatota archaeon]
MAEIKLEAEGKLKEDLEMLKNALGAKTLAETVRRAIAREVVLQKAIDGGSEVVIEGNNKAKGKQVRFLA